MITIVNVGPHGQTDPGGERNYILRINDKVIAEFKHTRSKGLAACLRQAAIAVENQRAIDLCKMLQEV